jgi:membrane protein required for colicin V production
MNLHFTLIDILAFAILVISGLMGIWRGLVREVLALIGWVAASWIAYHYATWVAYEWLTGVPGGEMTRLALGFVILFIVVMIVCALVGKFLAKLMQQAGLSPMDRFLGFAFGLLRGLLVVVVLSSLATLTSISQTTEWRKAWSLPAIELLIGMTQAWLPDEWAAQVSGQLKK